jgi:hypothetical protein
MIGYNGIDNWDESVELVETTTKVLGGISGPSNLGMKNLSNRTVYLKTKLQDLQNAVENIQSEVGGGTDDMSIHLSNPNPHPQYVRKTGDVMSGMLFLAANPIEPLHAATKQYVDTATGAFLPLSGGTLGGFLTLHSNPTANLHAATKQYVDATVTTHIASHTSAIDPHPQYTPLVPTFQTISWTDSVDISVTAYNNVWGDVKQFNVVIPAGKTFLHCNFQFLIHMFPTSDGNGNGYSCRYQLLWNGTQVDMAYTNWTASDNTSDWINMVFNINVVPNSSNVLTFQAMNHSNLGRIITNHGQWPTQSPGGQSFVKLLYF